MIEVRYNLNMVPDKGSPIHINVSQNDDKCRTFIFKLYSSDGSWTAPASATSTIEGRKDDGKFFSFACTYSNGEVTVIVQQQMVAVSGKVRCKIKLVSGAETIESAPFYFVVNPKSMPVNADMSKSDVVDAVAKATQKIVDQVAENIPEDYVKLNEDVSGLKQEIDKKVTKPQGGKTGQALLLDVNGNIVWGNVSSVDDDNGGDSGTDYSTQISLPYTANNNSSVKITLSAEKESDPIRGTNEISETKTSYLVIKNNTANAEATDSYIDELDSVYASNISGNGYFTITNKDIGNTWGSDIWFAYVKVKIVDDQNATYSIRPYCSLNTNGVSYVGNRLFSDGFNKNNYDWQELYTVGKVTQIDVYINQSAQVGFMQVSGSIYIENITLVNLTRNGLESKTIYELLELARDHAFDDATTDNSFSCVVCVGDNRHAIDPFTVGNVTKYYDILKGETVSIERINGYYIPKISAFLGIKQGETVADDSLILLNTRFRNQKCAFEGDSITDYDYLEDYGGKSWATYVQEILQMNLISNSAVGGSLITHGNEAVGFSVQQRIANTTYPSDLKFFGLMAGTNDWAGSKTLGDLDSTDVSTICGALNFIIDRVQTQSPNSTIVIVSPIHRQGDNGGHALNSAGYSLSDMAETYRKICERWGVKFINGLYLGLNCLNETNLNNNYVDGLHPNVNGHKIIAVECSRQIATF